MSPSQESKAEKALARPTGVLAMQQIPLEVEESLQGFLERNPLELGSQTTEARSAFLYVPEGEPHLFDVAHLR